MRQPDRQSDYDPQHERLRPVEDRRIVAQRKQARETGEPEPPSYGVVEPASHETGRGAVRGRRLR